MLTDLCVYTIKHSDDLRATLAKGRRDTYTERKKWVRARELLDEAKRAGKRLPVIFAPAEGTFHLFAWALLDEIIPDKTSSYTFSELRLLDPQPHKSTLKKASDGEPLAEWFIRPYAICRTPDYLMEQRTVSGENEAASAESARLAADVKEAELEFAEGRCSPATPEEIMREIME
jgi:hypothetical protein